MLKRVRWPADDCFCTGLIVITSSLSFPAVGGKKWSTIWCSLIGIEWRKISSSERMRPSFTRRPSLVTGIHLCRDKPLSVASKRLPRGARRRLRRRRLRREVEATNNNRAEILLVLVVATSSAAAATCA